MSPLDDDWVDDDDYFPEEDPDIYEEDMLDYLSNWDDPEREVPGGENENPRFIDVHRTSDCVAGAETILPVLDGKENVRSNPALSCKRRRLMGKQGSGYTKASDASSQKPVMRPQFDEKKMTRKTKNYILARMLAGKKEGSLRRGP